MKQKSKKATHKELCDQALEHYKTIAKEVCSWNSIIPKAIKFYKENKKGEEVIDNIKFDKKMIEEIQRATYFGGDERKMDFRWDKDAMDLKQNEGGKMNFKKIESFLFLLECKLANIRSLVRSKSEAEKDIDELLKIIAKEYQKVKAI